MARAWTLITVAGFALILLSLFADMIGLGANPTFGWRQISGVILGLLLILAAPYMKRRQGRMADAEETQSNV